jgi:glycosyltransferase involved in cell wall biosynthesis
MRVAIAARNSSVVGGIESYLRRVVAMLSAAGVELALLSENDSVAGREPVAPSIPLWCIRVLGMQRVLAALEAWRPDLIFVHGLEDTSLESQLTELAPAILFAHDYYGACISGEKTFRNRAVRPCARRFGWQCLLHFYPHRCGGLDPRTMWRDYSRQMARARVLEKYSGIVTASEHMRREYLKLGIAPQRVHRIGLPVERCIGAGDLPSVERSVRNAWRLLFAARMTPLKGGDVLLRSLPRVADALAMPLKVTMAGDGPARAGWERHAAALAASNRQIAINFCGWLDNTALARAIRESDLLVMPSLWPEPFGVTGVEAAAAGVPSAAFETGGISEWLLDGTSGALAPADPPTADGLADAIVRCLRDPDTHAQLCRGAREAARRFAPELHLEALLGLFGRVARVPGGAHLEPPHRELATG